MNDPNFFVFFIVFGGAPLMGTGIYLTVEKVESLSYRKNLRFLQKGTRFAVVVCLILVVCVISYPFVLWSGHRYEQIKYPLEYSQMVNFVNQIGGDFRILLLPPQTSIKHKWAPYRWIGSLDGYLLSVPFWGRWTLEHPVPTSRDFSISVDKWLQDNSSSYLSHILRFPNGKYIVLMKDVESELHKLERYFSTLNSQRNIRLEKQFGNIFVYKISDEYFLPHIYGSEAKY